MCQSQHAHDDYPVSRFKGPMERGFHFALDPRQNLIHHSSIRSLTQGFVRDWAIGNHGAAGTEGIKFDYVRHQDGSGSRF
jgi:hypothetical protein